MEKLQKVLEELKPYVVVVGSYAKGTATKESDIDLYVKRRNQSELDNDWYGELEEHYIDKVIEIFESNGLSWDSMFMGYIHTNDLDVQIEVSERFKIKKDSEEKKINLFGVEMFSMIDDKDLKAEEII